MMAGQRSKIQENVRFRILRLLEENLELSQRELAREVGISTGSVNYLLKALTEKCFVKLGNFKAAEDKRRYAYVLTAKGIAQKAALTRAFLKRKMEEYEALREEIKALSLELENGEATTISTNFNGVSRK